MDELPHAGGVLDLGVEIQEGVHPGWVRVREEPPGFPFPVPMRVGPAFVLSHKELRAVASSRFTPHLLPILLGAIDLKD